MSVLTLHDLLNLHFERGDFSALQLVAFILISVDTMDREHSIAHGRHVIVLEEDHLVGVLDDGAGIGGKEILDLLVVAHGSEGGGVIAREGQCRREEAVAGSTMVCKQTRLISSD